jgi:hypothetical protein
LFVSLKLIFLVKQSLLTQKKTTAFLFGLLMAHAILSFPQHITKVNATGTALIFKDISPNQARELAINDAKLLALRKAGITEHINVYQTLFSTQATRDFSQVFTSDILSEMQGAVKTYEIVSEKLYCKSENEIILEVALNAEVIRYDSQADPGFDFDLTGIKGIYKNDDALTFRLRCTKHGYLTVFNISDTEASLLYPSSYEQPQLCNAGVDHQFPKGRVSYVLHTENKLAETNRLLFVFTKTEIPYVKHNKEQVTSSEDIFNWIYSITPDQRKIEYLTLIIQN